MGGGSWRRAIATYQFSVRINTPTPANNPTIPPVPADGTHISTYVMTSLTNVPPVLESSLARSSGGLNVGISCPPGAATSPGYLTCVIRYSNSGSSTILANLMYAFPSTLTVLSHTSSAQVGAGTIAWKSLSLAQGAAGFESVNLQVPAGMAAGTLLSHSVLLQAVTAGVLSATAGTESFIASTDALQLGVSATPDPVQAGHSVVYSIQVSNPGAATNGAFFLRASVPNDTSVAKADAGDAYCTGSWPCQAGEELYWQVNLGAGASASYQFAALVQSSAPPPGTLLTSTLTTGSGGSAVSVDAVATN